MSVLGRLHGDYVHQRRIAILSMHLAALLPYGARVLDVGCGDGRLAARLLDVRPDLAIEGVDVLVRAESAIRVRQFDGARIPHANSSVDVVALIDVLHHTDDPAALLRDSVRVSRSIVLLKDHVRQGFAAQSTLRVMDWVGNARYGVRLPYNYWTRAEWGHAFDQLGLTVDRWESALHLYPRPASWLFDRSLHFVARLNVARN